MGCCRLLGGVLAVVVGPFCLHQCADNHLGLLPAVRIRTRLAAESTRVVAAEYTGCAHLSHRTDKPSAKAARARGLLRTRARSATVALA